MLHDALFYPRHSYECDLLDSYVSEKMADEEETYRQSLSRKTFGCRHKGIRSPV